MYQKVLVPLDGSTLAECALSELRHLAKGDFVGEVLLVTVIETHRGAFADGAHVSALRWAQREKAHIYLDHIRRQLLLEGIQTKMELLEGRPAQSIVSYAEQNGVHLILIATHGYTGMKQMMLGSVALHVLHDARVPVLLIRPEECR